MKSKSEILQKVKLALDIRDDSNLSDVELYTLLEKARNRHHPDKTTDVDVKKSYESKFKDLTSLLHEFGESIAQMPIRNSHELALYGQEVSFIESKQDILKYQKQIESFNVEIDKYKTQINILQSEIERLMNKNIEEETKRLLDLYKPNKANIYAIGFLAIIGLLSSLMLQVEKIANLFAKYMPFLNSTTITYVTLSLLLLSSATFLIKYLQEKTLNNWIKLLQTTYTQNKFIANADMYPELLRFRGAKLSYEARNVFGENAVFTFIENEFMQQQGVKKIYYVFFLRLKSIVIVDNLKNIFIHELLNRGVINPAGNKSLEKFFRINDKEL